MQVSTQYSNSVSLIGEVNRKKAITSQEEVAASEQIPEFDPNQPHIYFYDNWSQRDKDIFNNVTEDLTDFDKGAKIVELYITAALRTHNTPEAVRANPEITMNEREFGELLKKNLYDLTHLNGGVNGASGVQRENLEKQIDFLSDFIKLRESNYKPLNTSA